MLKKILQFSRPIIWGLGFVILLALIWQAAFLNLDPDLGWHLKFGRDIALTKQLPHDQIHLWTINGTWVDHEWLTNLLMWLTYEHGNYIGLSFIFALITTVSFWLIAHHLKQTTWPADLFIATITALGFLGIQPHLGPRAQFLSFLFLALEIIGLKKLEQKITWRRGLIAVIFFWLWTNLHAGFIIGLVVSGFWTTNQLWKNLKARNMTAAHQTGLLGLSCLATIFLTPYGPELYNFLNTYNNTAYLKYITEWKALWTFPINYFQAFFLALSVALTIIVLIFNHPKHIRLWGYLACLMFFIMSFKSVRHFPLFFVCFNLIILPDFLQGNFSSRLSAKLPTRLINVLKIVIITALLLIAWRLLFKINFINNPFQDFCQDYPCYTARLLQNNPRYSQLKLFNHYNYGGWLIWVWPEKKLFIDGRIPQYPLNGHSLIEEYMSFADPSRLADQLKAYDIEVILWTKQTPRYELNWLDKWVGFKEEEINSRQDEFKKYIESSPDWRLLWADEASTVYIRQDKY